MPDLYAGHTSGLDSPAIRAFAITPNDSNDLAVSTRAIWTGAGGTIVAILEADSSSVTFTNVPAGQILPIRAKRVLATGTTASMNMIGLA